MCDVCVCVCVQEMSAYNESDAEWAQRIKQLKLMLQFTAAGCV